MYTIHIHIHKHILTKKQVLVDAIFQPNLEGVSEWVSRETISEHL